MGGRAQFFELLASEKVNGDQMDLGVTVLSRLGGAHVDDLAGTVLDADETVLPQSRTLHGERLGGTGIGALEGVLMLREAVSRGTRSSAAAQRRKTTRRNGRRGCSAGWGKGHMRGCGSMERTCASSAMVVNES